MLDSDFKRDVSSFIYMASHARCPRFDGNVREFGNVNTSIERLVVSYADNGHVYFGARYVSRDSNDVVVFRNSEGQVLPDEILQDPLRRPDIDTQHGEAFEFVQRVGFSNIVNSSDKAIKYLQQLSEEPDQTDEILAMRRDICNAVLTRWQASVLISGRLSKQDMSRMALENFQADNPDMQLDLMRYVNTGAKAYEARYAMYFEAPEGDAKAGVKAFSDANLAFSNVSRERMRAFMDLCADNFSTCSPELAEAGRDVLELALDASGSDTLRSCDFGLKAIGDVGLDSLGVSKLDIIKFQTPDVSYITPGRDTSDLDAACSGLFDAQACDALGCEY